MCSPSPCGPYSTCRTFNQHAVCSCAPSYVGAPPNCRPECVVSSDCAQNRACNNAKCIDPCPGTCGQNARCQVVGHNPICSCETNFVGDPFIRCVQEERKTFSFYIVNNFYLLWNKIRQNRTNCPTGFDQSMCTVTVRSKFELSRCQRRNRRLFLHSKLYWSSSKLPSRMHPELWVSRQSCMRQRTLHWSLSRRMRTILNMYC